MVDISAFIAAIVEDQYDWGEFGRSEETPGQPRTAEQASAKPNFWISAQAVFALVAIAGPEHPAVRKFELWVERERGSDGWWTTQTGAVNPRGQARPTKVRNLRHTAKGLDLLACRRELTARDLPVIEALLDAGHPDGSWPGYHNGAAEIWATAYVVNLLARLDHEDFTWLGLSPTTLRSRLEKAVSWLVERREKGLWSVDGQDPLFTTEAVLTEVGALLATRRRDVCNEVAAQLLTRIERARRPTTVWALALTWRALEPSLQAQVIDQAAAVALEGPSGDVIDRACNARIAALDGDVTIAAWYGWEAGGHESALPRWAKWDTGRYQTWCIRTANSPQSDPAPSRTPRDSGEAWRAACLLVERWGGHVEHNWQALWNGDEHVDEAKIQASFVTFADGAELLNRVVFPEVQTGRGPVDFVFVNGLKATTYIEFKRADHARLIHGGKVQLPTYIRAAGADAGLLVCVAFDDADIEACADVTDAVESLGENLFMRVIAVDARRKPSASKA